MKIMRVKQQDGTLVDIPMGKGADGKSAYEYAKEGGYTGTEAEFTQLLGGISSSLTPAVSASDNGKFLRVVNGRWAAATVASAEEVGF